MFYLLFAFSLAITPSNKEETIGHMLPYDDEKLPQSIYLEKGCKNIHIDEWINKNNSSVKFIKNTCNQVSNLFYKFAKNSKRGKEKKWIPKFVYPSFGVSILSLSYSFRSLNDTEYRFANRPSFCNHDGKEEYCNDGERPSPLYGYTSYTNKWLFIHNETMKDKSFSKDFKYHFSHELFHVFSSESGFLPEKTSKYLIEDEIYAEEFGKLVEGLPDDIE